MKSKDKRQATRFTIGQGLVVIAVLAGLMAVPQLAATPERVIPIGVAIVLVGLVATHLLVDAAFGAPCPECGRWALRRLARHRQYYRCTACRGRFRRSGFTAFEDASGPEHFAKFRKPTNAGTWMTYTTPEDLEGTASGALLDYKRTHDVPAEELQRPHAEPSPRHLEEARSRVRAALKKMYAPDEP
jgi:hypothetical protein